MCTCDLTTDMFEEDFAKSHCFLSCQCSEQVPHLLQESIWWSEAHIHSGALCIAIQPVEVFVYELQRNRDSFHHLRVSSGELFFLHSSSLSAVAGDWSPDPTSWDQSLSHAGIWQPIMKAFEVFIWDLFPFLSWALFPPLSVSSTSIWLTVAQHPVSVYQSHRLLTASLAMDWSILLKCWLSKRLLLCGREVMYCGISARAFSALQYKLFEVPKKVTNTNNVIY